MQVFVTDNRAGTPFAPERALSFLGGVLLCRTNPNWIGVELLLRSNMNFGSLFALTCIWTPEWPSTDPPKNTVKVAQLACVWNGAWASTCHLRIFKVQTLDDSDISDNLISCLFLLLDCSEIKTIAHWASCCHWTKKQTGPIVTY